MTKKEMSDFDWDKFKLDVESRTEDLPVTHIMIPDTQAKLDVPTDHLNWIGMFIVEEYHNKNIKIIHIGDHADMPSLSFRRRSHFVSALKKSIRRFKQRTKNTFFS